MNNYLIKCALSRFNKDTTNRCFLQVSKFRLVSTFTNTVQESMTPVVSLGQEIKL